MNKIVIELFENTKNLVSDYMNSIKTNCSSSIIYDKEILSKVCNVLKQFDSVFNESYNYDPVTIYKANTAADKFYETLSKQGIFKKNVFKSKDIETIARATLENLEFVLD